MSISSDIPPLLNESGPHPTVTIDKNIQDEMNSRLHVRGGMGNNITLISNIPIGVGTIGFVLAGKLRINHPTNLSFIIKAINRNVM